MASRPSRLLPSRKKPRYKFLASACLAGIDCTYNAENNLVPAIRKAFAFGDCLAVCPEVMAGLGVPRPPAEITGGDGADVLGGKARIVNAAGKDITKESLRATRSIIRLAKRLGIKEAILKSKSPCCGKGQIYDGTFRGILRKGNGLLATALIINGIKVYSESSLKK